MLPKLLAFLTLTATTTLADSLFYLTSTTPLPILYTDNTPNAPASQIQNLLWRSLSSCPTKHYAVIIEPRILTHNHTYSTPGLLLPETPNTSASFLAQDIDGRVNIIHVLNTILMDCLHHGILTVKELDTSHYSPVLPELSAEAISKNIMYARMPEVDVRLNQADYVHVMRTRKDWVERVLGKYFGNEDYMLIYWREDVVEAVVDRDIVPPTEAGWKVEEDEEQNPFAQEELKV